MRCMVIFCKNKGNIPGMTYFMLTSRRHDPWMRALGRDPTKEHLTDKNCVCHVHFREEDKYVVNNKIRLRPDAIPRLSLRKPCLPTFQTINRSLSQSDGVSVTSKPEFQATELVPETSCPQPDGSGNKPSTNQMEDVTKVPTVKKSNGSKVVCRMCLEPIAEKNKMVPLTLTNINFSSESVKSKQKKNMETFKITSMIQIVMPDFEFNAVSNPIACHKCVARLVSACEFIEGCRENGLIIQLYKSKYCPNVELVSCEDVAQNKSLLMEEISPGIKSKTSKNHDTTESVIGSRPKQKGNSGSASDISQAERCETVSTTGSASRENFATDTSLELCSSIKRETEDTGDYGGYGGDSHFVPITEEMSCIVKEETVVKEDVFCDFTDIPNKERIAELDMDYHVKDEDCLQPDALGTSFNYNYH